MKNFKIGFIKRAQEYGINTQTAEYLFKNANMTIPQHLAEMSGAGMKNILTPEQGLYDPSNGAQAALGIGVGGGGLAGAGLGALSGMQRDSHGETHKLRNALIGGATGAGLGGAGGFSVGESIMNNPSNYLHGAGEGGLQQHISDFIKQFRGH